MMGRARAGKKGPKDRKKTWGDDNGFPHSGGKEGFHCSHAARRWTCARRHSCMFLIANLA